MRLNFVNGETKDIGGEYAPVTEEQLITKTQVADLHTHKPKQPVIGPSVNIEQELATGLYIPKVKKDKEVKEIDEEKP